MKTKDEFLSLDLSFWKTKTSWVLVGMEEGRGWNGGNDGGGMQERGGVDKN